MAFEVPEDVPHPSILSAQVGRDLYEALGSADTGWQREHVRQLHYGLGQYYRPRNYFDTDDPERLRMIRGRASTMASRYILRALDAPFTLMVEEELERIIDQYEQSGDEIATPAALQEERFDVVLTRKHTRTYSPENMAFLRVAAGLTDIAMKNVIRTRHNPATNFALVGAYIHADEEIRHASNLPPYHRIDTIKRLMRNTILSTVTAADVLLPAMRHTDAYRDGDVAEAAARLQGFAHELAWAAMTKDLFFRAHVGGQYLGAPQSPCSHGEAPAEGTVLLPGVCPFRSTISRERRSNGSHVWSLASLQASWALAGTCPANITGMGWRGRSAAERRIWSLAKVAEQVFV